MEHVKAGPESGKIADNIADRPVEYMDYVRVLVGVFNTDGFKFSKAITNNNPSLSIFYYVKEHGKTKENNIFLLSSYIDLKNGAKSFTSTSSNQIKLLEGYLNQQGINFTTNQTQTTSTTYTSSASGNVPIATITTTTHYNLNITQ